MIPSSHYCFKPLYCLSLVAHQVTCLSPIPPIICINLALARYVFTLVAWPYLHLFTVCFNCANYLHTVSTDATIIFYKQKQSRAERNDDCFDALSAITVSTSEVIHLVWLKVGESHSSTNLRILQGVSVKFVDGY